MIRSTAAPAPPSPDHPEVTAFIAALRRQETAPKTWQNYRSDLARFGRWFAGVHDEAFSVSAVTPTDIRAYRRYTINEAHHTPATVNRRLAALRTFFGWARGSGLITEELTTGMTGIAQSPRSPTSREKRELDRLIRTVKRHGSSRDQAIVLRLRHPSTSSATPIHRKPLPLATLRAASAAHAPSGPVCRGVPRPHAVGPPLRLAGTAQNCHRSPGEVRCPRYCSGE